MPDGGSVLVGEVTDANTGEGVTGATVTVGDVATTTVATPDDDGLSDGAYWMYLPTTGPAEVTAAASKYESASAAVTLDGLVDRDLVLAAGQLLVTPGDMSHTQELGSEPAATSVTVTNTGTAPVDVRVSERDRDFTLLRANGDTTTTGEIATSDGADPVWLDAPTAVGSLGAAPQEPVETTSGPHAAPWTDIADHPKPVMDNAMVRLGGKLYSIGGSTGTGPTAEVWVYDPATMAWARAADLPAPRNAMAAAVVDGVIVATGGWGGGDPVGDTWIYDPADDAWTVGAPSPAPRAAAATATVNGRVVIIGGCTTQSCAPMATDVVAYDPAADEWEALADHPDPVAFAACGAIDWIVYCAGGNGGSATAATHAYDPGSDTWTRMADAPYDVWGASHAAVNGQLLVVGGVQRGQITNVAHAYDPVADAWQPMPFANQARYRGGGACGFYRVGGSVQNYQPDPAGEVLPGFDQCAESSTDVGWLELDTVDATLAVGESVEVVVTTLATVDQPGEYLADMAIAESTPYPQAPVSVTMTVTPPHSWARVTGTVNGLDCAGEASPIVGGTVQLSSKDVERTFVTDDDGAWAFWMDQRGNSRLTVTAAKDGYGIATESARLKARSTTTVDLTLDRLGC